MRWLVMGAVLPGSVMRGELAEFGTSGKHPPHSEAQSHSSVYRGENGYIGGNSTQRLSK